MVITIDNVKDLQERLGRSVVPRARVVDPEPKKGFWNWLKGLFQVPKYILLETLTIQLTNGDYITIEKGFIWDLSSVPRFMWGIFPPDGNFELASLIHDYLYKHLLYTRKFCDVEMFTWSKAVAGTVGRNTLADHDNWSRYAGVRIGGWKVWNRNKRKLSK